MIDPDKALRNACYEALNGNITVQVDGSGSEVKFFDGPADDENIYVILGAQSSNDRGNKANDAARCSITLDIVCKLEYSASKEYLDDVAQQIDNILRPTIKVNGLVSQDGVQFGRLVRENGTYLDLYLTSTQVGQRKLVTYSTTVFDNSLV
jgi:hypothetical protein